MPGPLRLKSRLLKRINRLRKKPVVYDYQNTRLLLNGRNWIDNRILSGRGFETAQIEKAGELIRHHKLDTLLDIGANFGFYTMVLCRNFALKQAHAFEPVKRNQYQFLANVYLNELWQRVELHPVALGSTKTDTIIHIDPNSTGISRLGLEAMERDASVFSEREKVRIEVLDHYLKLENQRIFVKIDVEGHEMETLAGMFKTMKNNHMVFQIEVDRENRNKVPELMQQHGYVPAGQIDAEYYFAPIAKTS